MEDRPLFVISIAARLAEMHPQTLRIYERKGLLKPSRSPGRTRLYSEADIARLRDIQLLTDRGVNLEGVKMVLELREQVEEAGRGLERMVFELDAQRRALEAEIARVRLRYSPQILPFGNSSVVLRRPVR